MFFLSTIDQDGRPTVSYKGGDPGFVKVVDSKTIAFPLFDGNGMWYSAGNVVGNAQRYASHIAGTLALRPRHVEVMVDDNGPGIPAANREDVFKPFFRLEQSRNPETGGTGLGLTIARDIIRGHGGDLELRDAPGGGLRAVLRLPL